MSDEPVQVRGARLVEKVLVATLEEVARVGFSALSIEEVAERANVNKTTIYRRWPTKNELVTEALCCAGETATPVFETGSLRGDLMVLSEAVATALNTSPGRALYGRIVSEAEPELLAMMHSIHVDKSREHYKIVEQAIARGELPKGSDAAIILEMLVGTLLHFAFLIGKPADRQARETIVGMILLGATAGGAVVARNASARKKPSKTGVVAKTTKGRPAQPSSAVKKKR